MFFYHPDQVCMSYWTHFKLSMNLSFLFFKGSCCAFVHAFIPDVLIKSSTVISNNIVEIINISGCLSKSE